ncbi:MAG TPA: DNA-binding protein [Vicinamibacteria bacterium]|nr:DNA-binding protein [Vicinamibacteria bacterium]
MKRTTVFLDEQLESELRALARRKRRPVAAEVRDALARHVAEQSAPPPLSFLGAFRSGRRDTAERHEELLFKRLGKGQRRAR